MNKRIFLLRATSLFLAVLLMVGTVFSVDVRAATFAQINDPAVFTKQPPGSVTCTLHANAMMLRRYAMLRGDEDWANITADAMQPTCWINGAGMRGSFTYKDISVTQASLPSSESDKKAHLIEFLKLHPEGVALFDANRPHAVLLTDYTDGQFYYADPNSGVASGRLVMTSSALVTIATADRYWYVKSPTVTVDAPDLSVIESPAADSTFDTESVKVSGWSISMKGVTSVKCVINDRITLDATQLEREDIAKNNPGYPTGSEGFECIVPAYGLVDGVNTIRIDSYSGTKVINSVSINVNYTYKGSHNIMDGTYYIKSAADDSYVLDVGSNIVSGANLVLNSKSGTDGQKFDIKNLGDGYYSILAADSELSISAEAGATVPGANVELNDYKDTVDKHFIIKAVGDGTYYIIGQGGAYLDLESDTPDDGANIINQYGDGALTQKWIFENADPNAVVWGDANDDMCVNIKDAVLMKRYIAGNTVEINLSVSDVNVDNNVDVKDTVRLQKYLAGVDTVLGQS